MGRKQVIGICHICGAEGKLSFEHVPPKSAFNDTKIRRFGFQQIFEVEPGVLPDKGGKEEQRGAGGYTLCEKCNNLTGKWYGNAFANWAYEAMQLLVKSKGEASSYYPFEIYPLRVLKQIVTMFFSVNHPGFARSNPELVKFVLNPEDLYLPPKFNIYCSFMNGIWARSSGITVSGKFTGTGSMKHILMSEIAFPPFVYVMTIDSEAPDNRLTDITWFSRYQYNESDIIFPHLNVLPVNYYLPGDYRTVEQMMMDRSRNEMEEKLYSSEL